MIESIQIFSIFSKWKINYSHKYLFKKCSYSEIRFEQEFKSNVGKKKQSGLLIILFPFFSWNSDF